MVFGAISEKGRISLKFIDQGVKINKEYYKEHVLEQLVLLEAQAMYGNDDYVFQQDSAPAHKATVVQMWCETNFPDFISSSEWPASLPDLNPLDYFVWGYMLQQLGNKKIYNLERFKTILTKIWDEIPQNMISASCENFFKRCQQCIKAGGERFELDC